MRGNERKENEGRRFRRKLTNTITCHGSSIDLLNPFDILVSGHLGPGKDPSMCVCVNSMTEVWQVRRGVGRAWLGTVPYLGGEELLFGATP